MKTQIRIGQNTDEDSGNTEQNVAGVLASQHNICQRLGTERDIQTLL